MTQYTPFKLDDAGDSIVLIEVNCVEPIEPVYRDDSYVKKAIAQVSEQAKMSLSAAMDNIKASAVIVLSRLKEVKVGERPSKIELEFGIKLDATAGAVIAQASTEVNYTVRLIWENTPGETAKASSGPRKRNNRRL